MPLAKAWGISFATSGSQARMGRCGGKQMRVIRTDTYFDKPEMLGEVSPLAKAISAAWFKDQDDDGQNVDLRQLFLPGFVELNAKEQQNEIMKFLGICLAQGVGGPYLEPAFYGNWFAANDLVRAFEIEIVVEQSPPMALPLSKLLSKAPGVAIGTFIGYQIGAEHPAIMLISVPGGILAVSSAIGIAKALERGLHNKVEALFKSKPKRARAAD
jgi:hypothetical protein